MPEFSSFRFEKAALVQAIASTEGVNGYASMPLAPQAGDAWPSWTQSTPLTSCGMGTTWHVFVVCADANLDTVVDMMDRLAEPLYESLTEVGTVELMEPVQLATESGGGALPTIRVRVTT